MHLKLSLFLLCQLLFSNTVNEFGSSLEWAKGTPKIKLSEMRGKAVFILFFQSWCPKCNVWSGEKLKEFEFAFGNDKNVILIAIKTDGGGISGALKYLKTRKVTLSKWYVGSDKGGSYHANYYKERALWNYMLIGADGKIRRKGFFGTNWNSGKLNLGTVTPVFKGEYAKEFDTVVLPAERCNFKKALAALPRVKTKDKDALKKVSDELISFLDKMVDTSVKKLNDPDNDWGSRYDEFIYLTMIGKNYSKYSKYTFVKAAKVNSSKLKLNKFIRKEQAADKAYQSLMKRISKYSGEKRTKKLSSGLKNIVTKYPDTKYAKIATTEL